MFLEKTSELQGAFRQIRGRYTPYFPERNERGKAVYFVIDTLSDKPEQWLPAVLNRWSVGKKGLSDT